VTLAVTREVPRSTGALEALRSEARSVLARPPRGSAPFAGTRDVERSLLATGTSRRLVERVCEAVTGRAAEGRHPLDLAGEEVGAIFPVARARRAPGAATVIALLGATGVGKSTVAAKLLTRLAGTGREVALATLDAYRVGAVEQARAYGRELGTPVHVVRDAARLAGLLHAQRDLEAVLLDTTGRVAHDADQVRRLQEACARMELDVHVECYLVLPAVASRHALESACAAAGELGWAGAIVTKLDETDLPAPALEFALAKDLPLAFLCDGPDTHAHLHRAGPAAFADLMLRGRLS
jgi:flagellar biosynthesis protein FlhF